MTKVTSVSLKIIKLFTNNRITDKAFLESIRIIDFGIQYVAKTEFACSQIEVLSERELYGKELSDAKLYTEIKRSEGGKKASEVQAEYRRTGKYLDEILKEIRKTGVISYDIR